MPVANPYVLLAIVIGLLVTHGAVGWKAYDLGKDAVLAERFKMEEVERRATEAANKTISESLSKMEVRNVYTTQKLEKEIVEKPVYRDCQHTDAAFGMLVDSFTAPEERAGVEGGGGVPEAGATD